MDLIQLQESLEAEVNYKTIKEAAESLKISPATLRRRVEQAKKKNLVVGSVILSTKDYISMDSRNRRLAKDRTNFRNKYMDAVRMLEATKRELHIVEALDQIKYAFAPEKIIYPSQSRETSVACMVASDWHIEETVDPLAVAGLNEYNLEIAQKRSVKFFQNGLKLIEMCRSKSTIDTLVLPLIGDFITGHIHEEFMEGNCMAPPEAIITAYDWIASGIDFLLDEGGFKRIILPCCVGNHGRTTQNRRISTRVSNSYEQMLYIFLAKKYLIRPAVEFKLTGGYHNYLQILNTTFRFHHGDAIRYQGGVGGVHIPLNKSIAQWNKARRTDVDVMGHYHAYKSDRSYVLNGSNIGYNPFALEIKADYEPPMQAFFMVHPDRGMTVAAPIFTGE